jgi:hypothetical protein
VSYVAGALATLPSNPHLELRHDALPMRSIDFFHGSLQIFFAETRSETAFQMKNQRAIQDLDPPPQTAPGQGVRQRQLRFSASKLGQSMKPIDTRVCTSIRWTDNLLDENGCRFGSAANVQFCHECTQRLRAPESKRSAGRSCHSGQASTAAAHRSH